MRGGGRITSLGAVSGLTFVRADKDGDGDLDALTAAAWDNVSINNAVTGTVNWNTAFGVPATAKGVEVILYATSGTAAAGIYFKALSTTTKPSFQLRCPVANQQANTHGVIPISAAGTSYYVVYTANLTGVYLYVVGWYL